MMHRREFLAGAVSLLAPPLAAEAEQAGKVWRIGFLGVTSGPVPGSDPSLNAFLLPSGIQSSRLSW